MPDVRPDHIIPALALSLRASLTAASVELESIQQRTDEMSFSTSSVSFLYTGIEASRLSQGFMDGGRATGRLLFEVEVNGDGHTEADALLVARIRGLLWRLRDYRDAQGNVLWAPDNVVEAYNTAYGTDLPVPLGWYPVEIGPAIPENVRNRNTPGNPAGDRQAWTMECACEFDFDLGAGIAAAPVRPPYAGVLTQNIRVDINGKVLEVS